MIVDDDYIKYTIRIADIILRESRLKREVEDKERLIKDGSKPRGYSSERPISRMEYYVRTALCEATRDEIKSMIDEITPQIKNLIRNEFKKRETQNTLVDMFMDSLKSTLANKYTADISVAFSPKEDIY